MPSGTIASGIGKQLRDARLARELSIEEIAWRTRIRPEYLRALEREEFASIGHHAFVRTHLRTYAAVLGLVASELEEAFRDAHEPDEPSSLETLHRRQRAVRKQRPKLSWLRAAIVASIALIAAAAVGVLHGPGTRPVSSVALPSIPARIDAPPQASRDTRVEAPARNAGAQVAPGAEVRLELTAVRRVWVRITGDGKTLFEGILLPGQSRSFTATARLDVRAGAVESLRFVLGSKPYAPKASGVWTGSFSPAGPVLAG